MTIDTNMDSFNKNTKSVLNIIDLDTSGPISGITGSEYVNKFAEKIDKIIENTTSRNFSFSVVKLDKEEHGTYASAVILCALPKLTPDQGIFCYTMILENTSENMAPIQETSNGVTIIKPIVVSDCYDRDFRAIQKEVINAKLGLSERNNATVCGVTVIPSDFDMESETVFNNLIKNAGFAIASLYYRKNIAKESENTFNLKRTKNDDSYIQVQASYNVGTHYDVVGLPQRSDVVLTFTENKLKNNQIQSLNNRQGKSTVFGTLTGYIDVFWNPVENVGHNPFGYSNFSQANTQKYSPLFVIRSLKTARAGTLEGHLAMLLASAAMSFNNEWVNSFQSRWLNSRREENRNKNDLGDVGVLNIEANLPLNGQPSVGQFGKPIDTREDSFGLNEFISFMKAVMRPELFIAIDMPIHGAESWYMDDFLASTDIASNRSIQYEEVIFAALNNLTAGYFNNHFKSGSRLWLQQPMPYHVGWYRASDGTKRDLADIDLLAVMNRIGVNDPNIGNRWAATWVPNLKNVQLQLTERMEIIKEILGHSNVVQTGWGQRAFINPEVINALCAAAADIGFNMSFSSAFTNQNNFGGRAMFDFARNSQGLGSNTIGSSFYTGVQNNTGNMNTGGFNMHQHRFQY